MKTALLNHVVAGNLPVAKMVSGDLATVGGTPNKVVVSPTGKYITTDYLLYFIQAIYVTLQLKQV